MDTYIRDKLAHASSEESFETLVSSIMNKADGIFLWVALVVKSLREGLENGLSCSDLTREVDILPDQLESLYRHILASLGRSALKKAYQTFAMVTELKKENYRMSLLAYSFLEQYEAGKGHFKKEYDLFPIDSFIGDVGKTLVHSTSRKLAGWCKGLVEPYGNPIWMQDQTKDTMKNNSPCVEAWGDWAMELDFAHRSVADFLGSEEVQRDMQLELKCFDPVDAVLQLIPSDVLFESSISVYNTLRSGITSAVFVRTINRHGLAQKPFTYLENFRKLLASAKPNDSMTLTSSLMLTYQWEEGRFGSAFCVESMGTLGKLTETASEGRRGSTSRKRHFLDPLHILTALGLNDYPLWHINNNTGLAEQPDSISSLACLCLDEGYGGSDRTHQLHIVLEALFSRGWLAPDSVTEHRIFRYGTMWSDDHGYYSGLNSDLTLWNRFLIKTVSRRYHPVLISSDDAERKRCSERSEQYDGKLLELFLKFKEDTEFSFEIRVDEETTTSGRDFVFNLGTQGLVLKFRTGGFDEQGGWRLPWADSEIGLPSEDATPARRHVSLREFIELSQFSNKAKLLRLMDQKSKPSCGNRPGNSTATGPDSGNKGHVRDQVHPSAPNGEKTKETGAALEFKLTDRLKLKYHLEHYLENLSRWVRCSLRNEYVRYAIAVLTGKFLFKGNIYRTSCQAEEDMTNQDIGVVLTTLFANVRERLAKTSSDGV